MSLSVIQCFQDQPEISNSFWLLRIILITVSLNIILIPSFPVLRKAGMIITVHFVLCLIQYFGWSSCQYLSPYPELCPQNHLGLPGLPMPILCPASRQDPILWGTKWQHVTCFLQSEHSATVWMFGSMQQMILITLDAVRSWLSSKSTRSPSAENGGLVSPLLHCSFGIVWV